MCAAPVVSCVMPTSNRPWFVQRALTYFLRAADPECELIVVDDGEEPCPIAAAPSPNVRYLRLERHCSIGAKRNLACDHAQGAFIVHWDDDDWYAPWRLGYQVQDLKETGADICGLDRLLYYEPRQDQAWEYAHTRKRSSWVAGNTLCYRSSFWKQHPFAEIDVGEDGRFVSQCDPTRVHRHSRTGFIVGLIHAANTSPKRTATGRWQIRPVRDVEQLMGPDVAAYRNGRRSPATGSTALVATGKGIGDILRATPIVRALHDGGRVVDVLITPDYPETPALLEGAPEIRQLFVGSPPPAERTYDDAVFAWWGREFCGRVKAERTHVIEPREWIANGENGWFARVADFLGCAVPTTPFARHSRRTFDLPPGTIALHPGCKADWPWKKWHGFDELAALLEHVVVVGLPEDVDNSRTWFKRPFTWPPHVRNYIGELSLADTAALLSQCAALVSNDSGLMHLGAALGIPTVGIFGITNPEREAMRAPHMMPLSKGLPCEPACRRERWGRRDCEHHLRCLKTLTPIEVRDKLMQMLKTEVMAERPARATPGAPAAAAGLRLAYHGHVFDASGYGAAARAYIHALHTAGVDVQVINLTKGAPAVRDELVESLARRDVAPDLRLFHGIPAIWAADAFQHPHYVAMTVWETTMMPPQWRNALRRALDVWLPCDFNARVFERALGRPVLTLPHPIPPPPAQVGDLSSLAVGPDDIVFYSIFEWQERKGPFEQMVAFLRAFPDRGDVVLVLKTGSSATADAHDALRRARHTTTSKARIVLCCEPWSDATVAALHARGDCYVSLHRGEGWGYPLFEAAVRGTPVVATAFGGPLDYLDRTHHRLVSYRVVPVRQRYVFYNGAMDWADPDVEEAAGHLRWTYEHLGEARRLAEEAAASLRQRYAPDVVGARGRERLIELLERTDSSRWAEVSRHQSAVCRDHQASDSKGRLRPAVPIPGSWFDADYFEYGRKSNWSRGYAWREFRGLFGDTAAFLTSSFPNARTYFDAGCAKGFLIRGLREAGKEAWGCDVSEWANTRADESARPFITLAAAEDMQWADAYDVLVAFHVLTQMTEQQVDAFLSRARPHIRIAMLAVIPLLGDGDTPPDGDLAHITWHERAWWHERFVRAGWRQDLLHKTMEQICQRHSLPGRMGWEVFLYSPGH